jgi:hypothetical protein
MAGKSRASLPLLMKSCAPARSASTAFSSLTVPDSTMKGGSSPLSFSTARARGASNSGIEKSDTTRSHGPRASAATIAERVWTLS